SGITAHLGGVAYGEFGVDILVAFGGIRIEGRVLQISLDISASVNWNKPPVTLSYSVDLDVVPLELRLSVVVYLRLLFWEKKIFDQNIWTFKLFPYHATVFRYTKQNGKPSIIDGSSSSFSYFKQGRRIKRGVTDGCNVYQVPRRDSTNTAFILSTGLSSSLGELSLTYAIGTTPGGTDALGWSKLTKPGLLAPLPLPNGIPLFWSVKGTTTDHQSRTTQCTLKTYDNTPPDGRMDVQYDYTSHPHKIGAKIVVFDDSPLMINHTYAIGLSNGYNGNQFLDWSLFNFSKVATKAKDVGSFGNGKTGKLTSKPLKSLKATDHTDCAEECINFGEKCISFDYEFHSEICDLHSVIEGPLADVRLSGTYKHFERSDLGSTHSFEHNLILLHGERYFLNAEITNVLMYKSLLSSKGTIVDFTPPEPHFIGNAIQDELSADKCQASIIQRCEDVTWKNNHRKIKDGEDAETVYNGHHPQVETRYTLTNHFASANWRPFTDKESGIFGYTWAFGSTICGTDISDYVNPHKHLSDKKFWTYTGYARDIHLPDGKYYTTVQAINNVIHGGSLVTTVCHSTPIVVDTTPPLFKGVSDILFDEDFNIMAIYFEAEDKESFLSRIDFGLGKTKHDVEVRGYSEISYPKRENPYILITDLNITDGEPAWLRLRAVNNVELSKAGHSDDPILIDRTNPIAGEVLDGSTLGQDQTYQPENNRICASWKGFYDPESGIEEYHWGVGSFPGLDDIVAMETLSRGTKNKCSFANLAHNTTYYSVIEAKNSALNSKTIKQSSNGVLVDMTKPNAGWVNDGDDPEKDQVFSSESALIAARWGNFSDEESEINHYVVDVFVNDVKTRTFDVGIKNAFDDFSMSFAQGDHIYSLVTAYNGAGLSVKMKSSGFIIDLTPPNLKYIHDTKNGLSFQSDSQSLSYAWKFLDPESGIKQYRLTVFEVHQGMKLKFYPTNEDFIRTNAENITLSGLSLQNGRKYLVKIVAINNADMPVSHESDGVMIDTSAPVISQVHIGLPEVEEEEEDGKVMHADQSAMTVSWRAEDYQSGIVKAWVAIGLNTNDTSITNGFKEFDDGNVARLSDLSLTPSSISDTEIQYYYVMVKVMNGAGLLSLQANSKPVYVMKSNVPGTVYDGREALSDEDFTYDRTSLAMSFNGFESEACNLIQYEWAIGYKPFTYDVLPFTDYGIVMHNETFGQAQIHLSLYEGSTYFITVRAKTGFNCPMGEYVISCSDGIKLDTTKPQIGMSYEENTITPNSMPLYQTSMDSVNLKWKIKDSSKISESWWSIGSLPKQEDVSKKINTMDNFIPSGFLKLSHGQTFYVNVGAKDKAGNEMITSSPPITIDTTPPEIHNFTCTPFISLRKSLVVCTWAMIEEWESVLANTAIGIGRNETYPDISEFHTFSKLTRSWTRDLRLRLKNGNFAHIHIIVKMQNLAGLETYKSFKIVVDSTPPSGGIVQIVTTTAATNASRNVQRCQIPQTYLEARVASWGDAESGIDRYQVAVGCDGKSTNILKFSNWIINDVILIPNLDMITGSRVVVTVRAFNKAGLYGQVKSDPVIISPNPKLYVYDGPTEIDIDYQKSLSSIEGNWRYSDNCHIESVEWGVESIDGKVIQKFQPVPSALHHFYSDLIDLQNGVTYINIIRTIDVLGRVRESRSNGLAVKIQPPTPATVRDGSDDDLDYQESTNELQINWDSFGKPNSKDPTERIVRYEVALGNDVRFEETRSNVHYFLDAGLSNNYVFKGLNLTSKTVTYYATVRAYSQAGSFQDGISDGIKVGFREVLTEGNIEYNAAQYMTDKISVSWSGFEADMGIDHFEVGISSRPPLYPNGTHDCYTFRDFDEVFNTKKMEGVGKDTFKNLKQLSLLHGHSYFVTVIAADVTGKCVGSTGKAVIIDTSPPEKGNVTIQGKYSDNIVYIKHYDQITIEWNGFQDNESGILEYEIKLYSSTTCYDDGSDPEKNTDIHTPEKAVTVKTENKITFYELSLKQFKTYIVKVTAKSKAGLQTSSLSEYIKCDTTPPTKGTVKVGDSWFKEAAFQPFTDKLNGTIALAHSEMAYQCQSQRPLDAQNELEPMKGRFRTECVIMSDSKVKIEIRHDDNLRGIIKGGVESIKKEIIAGNYSSKLTTARGKRMVTSIFLATGSQFVKEELDFQVKENQTDIDYDLNNTLSDSFSNITNFETSNMEMLNDSKMLNKSTVNSGMSKNINHTSNVEKSSVLGLNDIFGFGFHIPGYTKDKQWFVFVWVFDQYISTSRQIPIDFDPTVSNVEYTIQLTNSTFVGKNVWNVKYFIQSEQIAEFNGLRFEEYGTFGVYNWNENEYVPPIENIDFPVAFEASSTIEIMKEPIPADKPCMFGSSFFEKDSFIQEFWVKVSEYENETDTSFDDYLLYASFCQKCAENCNIG
ncbi:uncharacterized protein LOC134260192, partial [Saccostrea cucullata]|uniref:uncharacterized protein LOC134260192 n=1 Tax=Saccostrea cuccullata TaxID=36930 RepID=UPI002ED5699A